jgi:beta-glucanase (GH16 family)
MTRVQYTGATAAEYFFRILTAVFLSVILCSYIYASDSRTLVWSDEFNGASLDTSKWGFDIGNGEPSLTGWGNNELEYYTSRSQNVRTENGNLIIEAIKESYQGCGYTSARIKTKDKGDWTYGRFEARARLPKGQGIWPAL